MDATWNWGRALVTGASSGIGRAIAESLAEAGTDVLLVARDVAELQRVVDGIIAIGGSASAHCADLARPDDVAAVVDLLESADPAFDLLVNNAALGQYGPFADLSAGSSVDVLEVNVVALTRLTLAAVGPMLRQRRGTIIQVSSTAAATPAPHVSVYAASKAYVASLGQSIHAELADAGVSCTTVLPGYTRTRYFERLGIDPGIPERRWMSPDRVAQEALHGAWECRPLVVPGRADRVRMELTSAFPTLVTGRLLGLACRVWDRSRQVADRLPVRRPG